ncbi:MAG: anaerobic sulfite reductase subunit AsrB [Lachnospiraceae bacterium]|nr:anaerobic sulfite reductase subunit AsrB [Lachnospiraceae bacterium]MCR5082806.1 anaerobic sulfite reductase subunit AsrB [Parasporobacterium sp.]
MENENVLITKPHKILSIIRHTKTEFTFRVECDKDPDFGQFFMLSLPKIGEAPISASGKGPGYVEFTIRNVGQLTHAIFDLEPGKNIFLRGPYGNAFPVKQFEHKDLVVICGGTAMAPVLTMINHFYNHPEVCKSVNIISGFKNSDAVLFRDEINKFKGKFNMIATLDNGEEEGFEQGMVTAHVDKIPWDSFEDYNVVIVGPPPMMKFSALECAKHGVTDDKIWVSFERKMCCGAGKCGHCKINDTYVCLEGPVFNYAEAKEKLMD